MVVSSKFLCKPDSSGYSISPKIEEFKGLSFFLNDTFQPTCHSNEDLPFLLKGRQKIQTLQFLSSIDEQTESLE